MTNEIFVERDILDQPFISLFDSIGFKSDVYGYNGVLSQYNTEAYDYVRIILMFGVLVSLVMRVVR